MDAENDIKIRLLVNNVVAASLQSWSQDFQKLDLIDFRGISKFTKAEPIEETKVKKHSRINSKFSSTKASTPVEIISAIDIDDFFKYLEAYRQKSKAVYKNIWHRGCITIVKKFKILKHKNLIENGNWTLGGFCPALKPEKHAIIGSSSEEKRLKI